MQRNRSFTTLLVCLSLLPLGAAGGEVYKWVDERGQIHYSNQRPPSADKVEVLDISESTANSSPVPNPNEELARIKDFTRQLTLEREARERQRLEERLNALENSYQRLQEEQQQLQQPQQPTVIRQYAVPPYYYPIPHPHHPPPHHPPREWPDIHAPGASGPADNQPAPAPLRPPVKPIAPREQGVQLPNPSTSIMKRGAPAPGPDPTTPAKP